MNPYHKFHKMTPVSEVYRGSRLFGCWGLMMGVTICIFALSYISSFFETEQETFKLKQRVEYKSETPSTKNEWQRQKISQRTTYNPFENEVTVKVKRNYGYHKDKYEVEVLNDNRPTKELEESEVMEAVDFYRD